MKKFLLFIPLLFLLSAGERVRMIDIAAEIKAAEIVRRVVVLEYDDSTMYCRYLDGGKPIPVYCQTRELSEQFRQELMKRDTANELLQGKWPDPGDTVLLVYGQLRALFAHREGTDYRFWDPYSLPFANSAFVFRAPFRPLSFCEEDSRPDAVTICFDGCLLAISEITER